MVIKVITKVLTFCTDPIDCQWSSWSQFQDCSKSCGVGSQFFQRGQRVKFENGGKDCVGNYIKVEECNIRPCSGTRPVVVFFLYLVGLN